MPSLILSCSTVGKLKTSTPPAPPILFKAAHPPHPTAACLSSHTAHRLLSDNNADHWRSSPHTHDVAPLPARLRKPPAAAQQSGLYHIHAQLLRYLPSNLRHPQYNRSLLTRSPHRSHAYYANPDSSP